MIIHKSCTRALTIRLAFFMLLFFIQGANASLPITTEDGKPFPSLAPMLKEVNPAVVNIATYSTRQQTYNPLLNDPFFRRFFNIPDQPQNQPPQKRQQSAGSGVIVDAKEGYVMTNYHVVKEADEVHVALLDGRSFKAEIIGSDPELDIAILQIDGKNLTQVNMTDSDRLQVGDFVVAIGNPFGLGQTVTTGIVSALGRSGLGIEGYEDFIQTDASINPGNSGGALVDLRGDLVGINTAIIAPAGGNVGIGFAIPVNMAKASMDQIIKHGEVKRGQIGVGIQDITADLRDAFDLKNGQPGVLVTHVVEDSPAEKAGIKPGDIIIAVNGKSTQSTGQLRSAIGLKSVGDKVKLDLLRDNKKLELSVKVGNSQELALHSDEIHKLLAGVRFENDREGRGVVVSAIAPNATAGYNGLRVGDLIVGTNRQRVRDLESFSKALQTSKDSVLLHINRNGGALYLVLR